MTETTDPVHIISLGAGVQSSTMALMAACGELTPMPIAYESVDEYRKVLDERFGGKMSFNS